MANYGPLAPNGDQAIVGTPTGGIAPWWPKVDDDPAAGQPDADHMANTVGLDAAITSIFFDFVDFPGDFGSIDTMTLDAFMASAGARTDDDITLEAQIFKNDEATALTDLITVSTWNAGGFTGGLQAGLAFVINGAGLAASEADWNAARIYVLWTYARNKGDDGMFIRLHALELNGTYTAAIPGGTILPQMMQHHGG